MRIVRRPQSTVRTWRISAANATLSRRRVSLPKTDRIGNADPSAATARGKRFASASTHCGA
jgi:hypothetical protein